MVDDDTTALREASERLDDVLRELQSYQDPVIRERLHEAVQLLMTIHERGLSRLLELAGDPALGGTALVTRIADDPLLGPLLLAHQLHPQSVDVRVSRALE